MSEKNIGAINWSFWVIGAVALIWNIMGVINFFVQMNSNMLASFPESHRVIIEGRPLWATGAFAIAVIGGALGCLLLLLKKSLAMYLFMASLLGVIVTMIHALGVPGSTIDSGPGEFVLTIVMPLAVAIFLIWYSKWTESKNWIG